MVGRCRGRGTSLKCLVAVWERSNECFLNRFVKYKKDFKIYLQSMASNFGIFEVL